MSYFTAVFKDLPQDELQAITQDERCRFMSHSHVGHERDALRQRIAELESTRPVCSLCAMKVDEAAGVDVAALNRRIAELESTIRNHGLCKLRDTLGES